MSRLVLRGPARLARIVALSVVTALVSTCGAPPPSPPTGSPSARPDVTPAPNTIGPAASEFVVWTGEIGFSLVCCEEHVQRLVKSGLFRLDDALQPQPDLAAGPCQVADDLVTIDCPLRSAKFHDGSAFTAHDVVFTFQLRESESCVERLEGEWQPVACIGGMPPTLESYEALDDRTIRFVLSRPDPSFLTVWLPWEAWPIESKSALEEQFASLEERIAGLDIDQVAAAAEALARVDETGVGDCAALAADVELLFTAIPAAVPPRLEFGEGTEFDPCAYLLDGLRFPLERLWSATSNSGIDAISAAYPFLFLEQPPTGTGPYRVENITTTEAHLRAHDEHHHGPPATSEVTVRVFRDPKEAALLMARGEGTIMLDPAVRAVDAEPAVTVADPHSFEYFAVMYNLRPGSLFAELELRRALAMCIDKTAIVDAATGGTGVPFDSPVPPSSWAYQPIQPVLRNVDGAKALIESAGWQMGEDGVYTKGAERLSTLVPVRADRDDRGLFVELLALQAAECGMELLPRPVAVDDYFTMIVNYPHLVSGTGEPFDVFFGGWVVGPDPDNAQWESVEISSEQNPHGLNLFGLSDSRVDELLTEGRSTYDQVSRARIYKELQVRINELQPYLSAWAPRHFSGMSSGLRSTAGPLNLDSVYWWWQLETLTLETSV